MQTRHYKEYQKMNELFKLIEESGLDYAIINLIMNLSPKTDISPRGFISLLTFIYDALQSDFMSLFQKIFQVKLIIIKNININNNKIKGRTSKKSM